MCTWEFFTLNPKGIGGVLQNGPSENNNGDDGDTNNGDVNDTC